MITSTQIFELEEEIMMNNNMSALDMQDEDDTSVKNRNAGQRRVSHTSNQASEHGGRPQAQRIHRSNRSNSSRGNADGSPPPADGPRARLTSMVAKGAAELATAFTSPLAQIYQPLVVDDDLVEDDNAPPPSSSPSQGQVSYGPAMRRRRLSSMHRFPPMPSLGDVANPLKRLPAVLPTVLQGQKLSDNAERGEGEEEEGEMRIHSPEPAEHVLETEFDEPPLRVILESRLHTMEERQKRIEQMLLQLVDARKSH